MREEEKLLYVEKNEVVEVNKFLKLGWTIKAIFPSTNSAYVVLTRKGI